MPVIDNISGVTSNPLRVLSAQQISQAFKHINRISAIAHTTYNDIRYTFCAMPVSARSSPIRVEAFGKLIKALGQRPSTEAVSGRLPTRNDIKTVNCPNQMPCLRSRRVRPDQTLFATSAVTSAPVNPAPHRFDHAKAESACCAGHRLVALVIKGSKGGNAVNKVLQPSLHLLGHIRAHLVVDKMPSPGFNGSSPATNTSSLSATSDHPAR
jgi:hypothetical protein